MGSTSQEMHELLKLGQVYRFMNGPLTLVMKAVFAAVYRSSGSENGTPTLKQCLQRWKQTKTPIFKNRKDLKDFFYSSVVKKVANVAILDEENLDIAFYYTAIVEFCNKVYNSLPKEAKQLVKEVYTERNKLSHGSFSMPDSVEQYVNVFEIKCEKLMVTVGKKLGSHHFDSIRPKVVASIEKVKKDKMTFDQFKQEQDKFFECIEAKFIRDVRAVLQTERAFGTSIDPFVKLVKQNKLSHGADYRISDVFVSPVLHSKNVRVGYENILTTLDSEEKAPKAVIVSGQGGCGKSTLCHIVFEQWRISKQETNKNSQTPAIEDLHEIDLIIYVEMKLTPHKTLLEYLRNYYLVGPMRDVDDEDVLKLLYFMRVLFVVDGYEEKMRYGDTFLENLVSSLPKSRFIITTRPEAKKECERKFHSHITWELVGFEQTEKNKFASNVFQLIEKDEKIRSTKVKKFKGYLHSRASCLEAHLKLPLTLALLIFLWLENYKKPEVLNRIRTASQLYLQLFKMLKEKLLIIRKKLKSGHATKDDVEEVILLLHEKALEQLKTSLQLMLSEENQKAIEQSCESQHINPTEILSAFLVCESSKRAEVEGERNNFMTVFSFFHRSQMEYYSACAVSQNLLTPSSNLADHFNTPDKQKYRETFIFLAGCLKQNCLLPKYCADLVMLCNGIVDNDDFNYWFSLLNETENQESHTCEEYDETMKEEISKCVTKKWKLEVKTLVSGLNLLAYCPCLQISELTLNLPASDDLKNMSGVQRALQRLKHARSSLHQERKTDLYLDFGGHSHDSINYLSDPMEYFGNWGKVVKFTGRVKEGSVKRLLGCQHADVRIKNLSAFNTLAEQSSRMRNLKKMTISVAFSKSEIEAAKSRQFSHRTAKIDLSFPKLVDNNVDKTIQFIKDTYPRSARDSRERVPWSGSFSRVTISGGLSYNDGLKVVKELQGAVNNEVAIESSEDLAELQMQTLMASALENSENYCRSTFTCSWNSERLPLCQTARRNVLSAAR